MDPLDNRVIAPPPALPAQSNAVDTDRLKGTTGGNQIDNGEARQKLEGFGKQLASLQKNGGAHGKGSHGGGAKVADADDPNDPNSPNYIGPQDKTKTSAA